MSQYPNPQPNAYPPPPTGYPPLNYTNYPGGPVPVNPMGPARRASAMMFILGGLVTVLGLCMGAFAVMPLEQLAAQQGQQLPPLPAGMSYSMVAGVCGVLFIVAGVSQLIIAGFMRQATATPIIFGIIVAGLILLYFVLNTLYAMMQGQSGAGGVSIIAIAVYGVQVYFLVQALRAVPHIKQMQAAYQAQYWQYMQQQQAYANANPAIGGGYNQTAYNAAPAGAATAQPAQTGWQWAAPAPPPPLNAPLNAPPNTPLQNPDSSGANHGQGSQQ